MHSQFSILSTFSTTNVSFKIKKNDLTLPLPCLIFPIESKDFLKNLTLVFSSDVPHHSNGLRKEGCHQPLSDAQTQRRLLASHFFVFLVTLDTTDHPILLETSSPLMPLTLLSLTPPPPMLSLLLAHLLGAPSSKVCVLEAGVFQSSTLGSLPFSYTFSWATSSTPTLTLS